MTFSSGRLEASHLYGDNDSWLADETKPDNLALVTSRTVLGPPAGCAGPFIRTTTTKWPVTGEKRHGEITSFANRYTLTIEESRTRHVVCFVGIHKEIISSKITAAICYFATGADVGCLIDCGDSAQCVLWRKSDLTPAINIYLCQTLTPWGRQMA